ncbi:hypothetical protein PA598K_02918 [Paenibacillus sp. 598K]|uniref:TetR/AcrR family transcriptional regulator n=1 Tax=Paenibacillus sp. 598K TaxID=1117987 RepID=UPI000FFAC162|nr:TetR/AcrR family transcriptional regulator [Paenibacillus sp. 598K]GBF74564.1 hypothetical protein PA598K_02918 [Paenibacillus sp. 598K]
MTASRIKQMALPLFAELGYEGASLSIIAKAVGIKTPSIYAHFESKEQLFLELMSDVIGEETQRLDALMRRVSHEPLQEQWQAAFHFMCDPGGSGVTFLRRTMMLPPPGLLTQLRLDFKRCETRMSDVLGELLHRGMEEGLLRRQEAGPVLSLFYGLTDGLLVERQLYDEPTFLTRREQLWIWFWQAIKKG